VHASRTNQFYDLMRGRQPFVTYSLVLINVAIFVVMIGFSGSNALSTVLHGGPVADGTVRDWGAQSPTLIEHGQWWRLFSELFLHASLTHIVFNMASLLAIGTLAERLYGSAKFLAIYLGAGLIGSAVSFAFAVAQGNLSILGVGASGAIFGVAGSLLTVRFQHSDVIPAALRRRVSSSMAPLVLISLFLAAVTPYVDNSAHIGGLIGGLGLSFVFPLVKTARAVAQ
jgi:rhomboid protease GluP